MLGKDAGVAAESKVVEKVALSRFAALRALITSPKLSF